MIRTELLAAFLALAMTCLSDTANAATAVEVNEVGATLFSTGHIVEASKKFREALALDPVFEPARRNLAVALAMRGQEEFMAGKLDDARGHLEEAAGINPEEPRIQYLLAMIYYRRGDLYEARRRVDLVLDKSPTSVPARSLSGDIFYQDGSLSRALREWEDALEIATAGEQHLLQMKIERAKREYNAESGLGSDVSSHFTIQFDGTVPRDLARAALRHLEAAYDRLWNEFGRAPRSDIPVIISSRGLFEEITRSPAVVSGTYDGKIRVPVGGLATDADAERLKPILAHELTHAFIHANVPTRLPLWFEEGLAEYFEGVDADAARRFLGGHGSAFASLDEVSAALRLQSAGSGGDGRFVAAYAAAFLAVDEMVRMDGFWLPRRILESMAEGRPFTEALRDAAGMDLPEFEERWRGRQR